MRRISLLCLSCILLMGYSCGLKYVPKELPQDFTERRQKALENHLREEFSKLNQSYQPITFGETTTVKPVSYKQLDSLYALKYKLDQQRESSRFLDDQIEMQRLIAVNDTNTVLYIEDHVFSVTNGDTTEVYFGLFQMNPSLEVLDYEMVESVFLPKKLFPLYKTYLFEESFLTPGYFPSSDEKSFYKIFKEHLTEIPELKKDLFIAHTLQIMKYARNNQSLNSINLIKSVVIDHVHGKTYASYKHYFPQLDEYIEQREGKKVVVGYHVKYSFESKKEPIEESNLYEFELNEYLEILSETKY